MLIDANYLRSLAGHDKIEMADSMMMLQIAKQMDEMWSKNRTFRDLLIQCKDANLSPELLEAVEKALID